MSSICTKIINAMSRKKVIESDNENASLLNKCLTTFDLTLIGMNTLIGAGIYIVSAEIAKNVTGPLLFISYLCAGLLFLLVSLCYVELSTLITKTGSAYTYVYVIIGEFPAFMVGWFMIFEYAISCSILARALSETFDSLCHYAISNWIKTVIITFPYTGYFSEYPDLLAGLVILIFTSIVITGVKTSTTLSNIIGVFTISFLALVITICMCYVDVKNWTGNILPYEINGIVSGISLVVFNYVGFECITLASEETINPVKSIPRAILICISAMIILNSLASASLTLMISYDLLDIISPYPSAFMLAGITWGKPIVVLAMISAMGGTLLSFKFALSRIVFAMATDGMLFKYLGQINTVTKTPVYASLTFGVLSLILSVFVNLEILTTLVSASALLIFIMVNLNILIMRYKTQDTWPLNLELHTSLTVSSENEESRLVPRSQPVEEIGYLGKRFRQIPYIHSQNPKTMTSALIYAFPFISFIISIHSLYFYDSIVNTNILSIIVLTIEIILFLLLLALLFLFEHNTSIPTFHVPFVPFVPVFNIFINVLLLVNFPPITGIRIISWMFIGAILYFTYGIRNSHGD